MGQVKADSQSLPSNFPISKKKKFAYLNRTYPTIELLYIGNIKFKKDVDVLRNNFGIKLDQDGQFLPEEIVAFDHKLIVDEKFHKKYDQKISELAEKYGLSAYQTDLEMFVESGMTPIDDQVIISTDLHISKPSMEPKKYHDGTEMPASGLNINFLIRKPVTLKQLNQWFEKYNGIILVASNDYFSGQEHSITKRDNLPRILEIIQMRNNGMKYREIADALCKMYSHDKEVIEGKVNEQSVKMIYKRHTSGLVNQKSNNKKK